MDVHPEFSGYTAASVKPLIRESTPEVAQRIFKRLESCIFRYITQCWTVYILDLLNQTKAYYTLMILECGLLVRLRNHSILSLIDFGTAGLNKTE